MLSQIEKGPTLQLSLNKIHLRQCCCFFFKNKGLKIVKIFLYSIIIENVSCSKLFDVYFDRGQPVSKICMLGRLCSY